MRAMGGAIWPEGGVRAGWLDRGGVVGGALSRRGGGRGGASIIVGRNADPASGYEDGPFQIGFSPRTVAVPLPSPHPLSALPRLLLPGGGGAAVGGGGSGA